MAITVSVKDVSLSAPVSRTLGILLGASYCSANTPYSVPNADMAMLGVYVTDLLAVLRTGLVRKMDASGNEIRPQTGIMTAVGQDATHTAFRLLVDLIA